MKKPKLLVLENYTPFELEERVKRRLEDEWAKQFEVEMWFHFHEAYYPENRVKTLKRLATADYLLAHHVFDGFSQLELFIEVLEGFMAKGKKITFYLMNISLETNFREWLDKTTAEHTPKEFEDDYESEKKYKKELNERFFKLLQYHDIYHAYRLSEMRILRDVRPEDEIGSDGNY